MSNNKKPEPPAEVWVEWTHLNGVLGRVSHHGFAPFTGGQTVTCCVPATDLDELRAKFKAAYQLIEQMSERALLLEEDSESRTALLQAAGGIRGTFLPMPKDLTTDSEGE